MTEAVLLVDGGDGERARLDRLTSMLYSDLRRTGLVKVSKAHEDGPPNSKSGTALQIGELVVAGVFSVPTITAICRVVIAYIERSKVRSVTWKRGEHEVKLTGVAQRDQIALIKLLRAEEEGDDEDPQRLNA